MQSNAVLMIEEIETPTQTQSCLFSLTNQRLRVANLIKCIQDGVCSTQNRADFTRRCPLAHKAFRDAHVNNLTIFYTRAMFLEFSTP
jgi:hypothetical protein